MEEIVQLNANAKLSEHLASPSEAALSNLSELNCVRLSPHFSLGEFTKSGSHPEVYNIPSHEAIANLKRLCTWLEVLRLRAGNPIRINSGYRSPQLNKRIGGRAYKQSPYWVCGGYTRREYGTTSALCSNPFGLC